MKAILLWWCALSVVSALGESDIKVKYLTIPKLKQMRKQVFGLYDSDPHKLISRTNLADLLEADDDKFYAIAAMQGEKLIGFACATRQRLESVSEPTKAENVALLVYIVVDPAFQKQGLGKKLVRAFAGGGLEDEARIGLVVPKDHPAREYFQKLGFTKPKELPWFIHNKNQELFIELPVERIVDKGKELHDIAGPVGKIHRPQYVLFPDTSDWPDGRNEFYEMSIQKIATIAQQISVWEQANDKRRGKVTVFHKSIETGTLNVEVDPSVQDDFAKFMKESLPDVTWIRGDRPDMQILSAGCGERARNVAPSAVVPPRPEK